MLGMAAEFRGKIGVNALWPRTAIKTAAVKNVLGGQEMFENHVVLRSWQMLLMSY